MSRADTNHPRPMPLAEADDCCGCLHLNEWAGVTAQCENCPLLIERKREAALRLARAL